MPRRSIYLLPRHPSRKRRTPLRIPQTPERPLILHQRDLVRRELLHREPTWFIKHRRGPRRIKIGVDPLEARAVPREQVTGTILERIIYRYLNEVLKEEFDFQSSLLGGRLELGGLVADFLLPFRRIIINPVGPTHAVFLQQQKDLEQQQTLAAMGYDVYYIDEKDIKNEYKFHEVMRRIFNLGPRFGSSVWGPGGEDTSHTLSENVQMVTLVAEARLLHAAAVALFNSRPNLLTDPWLP